MAKRVPGSELKVGDTIEVWWSAKRDTIIELRPYGDNRVATFAVSCTPMTIEPGVMFSVVARAA